MTIDVNLNQPTSGNEVVEKILVLSKLLDPGMNVNAAIVDLANDKIKDLIKLL